MTWFKVDDILHGHPKVIEVPLESMGLWVLAGSWCACYLRDGFISFAAVSHLGGTDESAQALVDADLWIREDTGFRFKNWEEFQPTKAEVEADRAKNAERMRKYRSNKASNTATNTASAETPTRPDPTRPKVTSNEVTKEHFDHFWDAYPRKIGKPKALLAYNKAIRHSDCTEILNGLEKWVDYWKYVDPQFIPHPTTWLNGERWQDQPPTPHDPSHDTQARRNLETVEYFRNLEQGEIEQ